MNSNFQLFIVICLFFCSCAKEEICNNGWQAPSFKVVFVDDTTGLLSIDPSALMIDDVRESVSPFFRLSLDIGTVFSVQSDTIKISTNPSIVSYNIHYNGQTLESLLLTMEEERVVNCKTFYRIQSIITKNQSMVCETNGEFLIKIPR